MGKSPEAFNFFYNGRFIFANGLDNGSFSGIIDDSCKDDTYFLDTCLSDSC